MNRTTTALLAALEALIAVAIGIVIPLVPLTVLWATTFGMAADWLGFWRAVGRRLAARPRRRPDGAAARRHWRWRRACPVQSSRSSSRSPCSASRFSPSSWACASVDAVRIRCASGCSESSSRSPRSRCSPSLATLSAGARGRARLPRAGPRCRPGSTLRGGGTPDRSGRCSAARRRAATPSRGRSAVSSDALAGWPGSGASRRPCGSAAVAVAGVVAVPRSSSRPCSLVTGYATITGLYETPAGRRRRRRSAHRAPAGPPAQPDHLGRAWIVGPGFAVGAGTSVTPDGTVLGCRARDCRCSARFRRASPAARLARRARAGRVRRSRRAGSRTGASRRRERPSCIGPRSAQASACSPGSPLGLLAGGRAGRSGPGVSPQVGPDAVASPDCAAPRDRRSRGGRRAGGIARASADGTSPGAEQAVWPERSRTPVPTGSTEAPSTAVVESHAARTSLPPVLRCSAERLGS